MSTIDDALQAAAERALRRPDCFDALNGWVSWTIEVAWHEVQAQWHRQARSSPGTVPDADGGPDPAAVTEAKLDLRAVLTALGTLSAADREAILSALDDELPPDGPLPAAVKMRRYRARTRLTAALARRDSQP